LAFEQDYIDAVPTRTMERAKEMGAMVEGTWGAQILDELSPQENDHMVRKQSSGGFFQTPLDRVLRNLGIKKLVVTGVATNFCVETTVREAVGYGYDIILVSDATASFDLEGHKASLKVIAAGFGDVMSTKEVVGLLAV
jgi:nicotinamidase-related amidase